MRTGCRSVAIVADGAVATNGYGDRVRLALEPRDERVPGWSCTSCLRASPPWVRWTPARPRSSISIYPRRRRRRWLRTRHGEAGGGAAGRPSAGHRPLRAGPPSHSRSPTARRRPHDVRHRRRDHPHMRPRRRFGGESRKVWTWGDALLPDLIVLDPEATATMPPVVTTRTGLDAFVHALEAVTGQRRDQRPPEPALAAVELVRDHLPYAVADGSDLRARAAMQEAAYLAGTAIDGCGTGIAHAIGHALGSLHHVPHGVAVAVGLEAALAWNVEGAPDASSLSPRPSVSQSTTWRARTDGCGPGVVCRLRSPWCPMSGSMRTPSRRRWWRTRTSPWSATHAARHPATRYGRWPDARSPSGPVCGRGLAPRDERHRPDRHLASPIAPRPAVPGLVGPQAPYPLPGHHRARDRLRRPCRHRLG